MSNTFVNGHITNINNKYITVMLLEEDNKRIRNIIKNYGRLDFVPLLGKNQIKVKYSCIKKQNGSPEEYFQQFNDKMCKFYLNPVRMSYNGKINLSFELKNIAYESANNPDL